ncbi:MAG: bacterial Ig-like domain-containing protein [Clostridiales bacterium]|nr:bacterial Ig-like domain-containing protein [Clostridiales bacterium]
MSYCIECNADIETETIKIPKISSITLSKSAYTYDGKVKNPSVIIKDTNGNKISPEYYTVTYASDCRKVGKYKVTVEFTGNYSGIKTLYFKIKPKTTRFTSVTVNSRIVSVKWQKQTEQVTGYQIQLSTTKKFKKSSSITFTNKDPK